MRAKNLTGPPMILLTKDLGILFSENGRLTFNLARGTLDGVLTAGMCQDHLDTSSLRCGMKAWPGGPNHTINPVVFKLFKKSRLDLPVGDFPGRLTLDRHRRPDLSATP